MSILPQRSRLPIFFKIYGDSALNWIYGDTNYGDGVDGPRDGIMSAKMRSLETTII